MAGKQDKDDSQSPVFTEDQQKIISELIGKKVSEVQDGYKSEINGLNRRNSDLENKIKLQAEEFEKSRLTEEEQAKYEIDKRQAELDAKDRELTVRANKEVALRYATENKLPLEMIEFLPLSNKDELAAGLDKLKAVVDGDRASVLEAFKKNGGDRPQPGGGLPKGGLIGREQISKMSPEAINKAFDEGRINLKG